MSLLKVLKVVSGWYTGAESAGTLSPWNAHSFQVRPQTHYQTCSEHIKIVNRSEGLKGSLVENKCFIPFQTVCLKTRQDNKTDETKYKLNCFQVSNLENYLLIFHALSVVQMFRHKLQCCVITVSTLITTMVTVIIVFLKMKSYQEDSEFRKVISCREIDWFGDGDLLASWTNTNSGGKIQIQVGQQNTHKHFVNTRFGWPEWRWMKPETMNESLMTTFKPFCRTYAHSTPPSWYLWMVRYGMDDSTKRITQQKQTLDEAYSPPGIKLTFPSVKPL